MGPRALDAATQVDAPFPELLTDAVNHDPHTGWRSFKTRLLESTERPVGLPTPLHLRRHHACAIEDLFELGKGDCGLDEYEVRSWTGWHRHVTLSLFALAVVAVIRSRVPAPRRKKGARG